MESTSPSRSCSSVSLSECEEDPRLLCGRRPSAAVVEELQRRLEGAEAMGLQYLGRACPCLVVVLVGDRSDSRVYVRIKRRMAAQLGIELRVEEMEAHSTTPDRLRDVLRRLNADAAVDGVIVQVPLPPHLPVSICQEIAPEKDVDGFNHSNMGKLALSGIMVPYFSPCTPRGVLELLAYHKISVHGKHVVILGRSNVVGLPLYLMLVAENATVTTCHSKTENLLDHTRRADILICAMGQPEIVKSSWVKHNAVVIDVGVSVIPGGSSSSGRGRVVGDVDSASMLRDTNVLLTPVPGGVGPMTVAMLMKATVEAFERRLYAAEMMAGEH